MAQCGAVLPVLAAGARPALDPDAGILHQAWSYHKVIQQARIKPSSNHIRPKLQRLGDALVVQRER